MESEHPLPIHTEAALLQAYVSHTLTPEEHQQVEHHLKSCPTCRQELQEVKTMQTALKTAIQKRPGPSPAAFAKVMSRIHQETRTAPKTIRRENETSWWESIENVFRSLFEIRWVPVLASFLIVGQAVLLLSVLEGPEGQVGPPPGPIVERGIPQGTPAIPIIKIQVEFVETAQEIQIRRLVQELGGQIVNGPTKEGLYTLGFVQKESDSPESFLSSLHTHPDLIKTAKLLQP
jgi:hypothetical protein